MTTVRILPDGRKVVDYWQEKGRMWRNTGSSVLIPLGDKDMARPIATLLREGDLIKNSKLLTEAQKNHALTMLRREIDEATGQSHLGLEEAGTGGVPPAPQSTPPNGRKA